MEHDGVHGRLRDIASGLRAHCRCGPSKVGLSQARPLVKFIARSKNGMQMILSSPHFGSALPTL